MTVFVFAIEPCRGALARLRAIARKFNQTGFRHDLSEGLANGITMSSRVNVSTQFNAKR